MSFFVGGLADLAVADVHGDFKAETHFSRCWFGPHHDAPCLSCWPTTLCYRYGHIVHATGKISHAVFHDWCLSIFMSFTAQETTQHDALINLMIIIQPRP